MTRYPRELAVWNRGTNGRCEKAVDEITEAMSRTTVRDLVSALGTEDPLRSNSDKPVAVFGLFPPDSRNYLLSKYSCSLLSRFYCRLLYHTKHAVTSPRLLD